MQTFGIDLASQPENTAVCMIDWRGNEAAVVELAKGTDQFGEKLTDRRLLQALTDDLYGSPPAMTAIDAPLGWPATFAKVIANQREWPDVLEKTPPNLLFRATDLHVAELTGKQPLAVTTERIAYAAIRANRVLGRVERTSDLVIDRSGVAGVVCETYPDAALRRFGLWPAGLPMRASYKSKDDPAVRQDIVKGLRHRAPWLTFDQADPSLLQATDDCLDALVCALVARACAKKRTIPAPDRALATVEGWIHIPEDSDTLETLVV